MKEVRLHVESLDDFARRSMETARRLDRGERKAQSAHISFESMEGLLKALTPNRWRLLRTLRHRGPSSIRARRRWNEIIAASMQTSSPWSTLA